jgi:hypothetical protein
MDSLFNWNQNDPRVLALISEVENWPGVVISAHKSSGQLYHKLVFLADLGLTDENPRIAAIMDKVRKHRTQEGLFPLTSNTSTAYGGTGQDVHGWALCDAPLLLYAVGKMASNGLTEIRPGVDYLRSLCRQNGWGCVVSKELGSFRGPGRKADPCPYATLIMVQLLSLFEDLKESPEVKYGVESLLSLWHNSKELHPYMFFMGTDFRKLKLPFIWYDILHVALVLSHFENVRQDERFLNMLQTIQSKPDALGLYTPESVWTPWSAWDFGQKKEPSLLMTQVVHKILKQTQQ